MLWHFWYSDTSPYDVQKMEKMLKVEQGEKREMCCIFSYGSFVFLYAWYAL